MLSGKVSALRRALEGEVHLGGHWVGGARQSWLRAAPGECKLSSKVGGQSKRSQEQLLEAKVHRAGGTENGRAGVQSPGTKLQSLGL